MLAQLARELYARLRTASLNINHSFLTLWVGDAQIPQLQTHRRRTIVAVEAQSLITRPSEQQMVMD